MPEQRNRQAAPPAEVAAPKAASGGSLERMERFVANPRRALWTLALPIMIGMSIQTLYMMVDMIFVGRLGADALTALAFNMPLVFLAMGMTFGLGSAVTALMAQSVGAQDKDRADAVAQHAVVLAAALTVAFMVSGLGFGRQLLGLLGVPTELIPLAWDYFQVIASGYLFMVLSVFLRSILSGEGDVRTPVMIQAAGTLLNIVLDPVFIFVLGMGVRGAALATIVSQALSASVFVYLMFVRKRGFADLDLRGFVPRADVVRDLVRIGIPASLSFLVMALGGSLFNRILVEYSADAVAAHQVGGRLDHIVIMPMVALASSLVTLVGMFYGAGRSDLLVGILRYAMTWAIAIGCVFGVVFWFLAAPLVGIFTDSPSIIDLGVQYLRIVVFAYPMIAVGMLSGRALQGLGKGTPELVLSLLRVVLISIPLAAFFTFRLELPAHFVWIAALVGSACSTVVAILWLRHGVRAALKRVAETEAEPLAGHGELGTTGGEEGMWKPLKARS